MQKVMQCMLLLSSECTQPFSATCSSSTTAQWDTRGLEKVGESIYLQNVKLHTLFPWQQSTTFSFSYTRVEWERSQDEASLSRIINLRKCNLSLILKCPPLFMPHCLRLQLERLKLGAVCISSVCISSVWRPDCLRISAQPRPYWCPTIEQKKTAWHNLCLRVNILPKRKSLFRTVKWNSQCITRPRSAKCQDSIE